MPGENIAQECVGSILEHRALSLWSSSELLQEQLWELHREPNLSVPSLSRENHHSDKEDCKEVRDVWTPPQTGSQTGGKHWKKTQVVAAFHDGLDHVCASAVTAQPLSVPLWDHGDRLLRQPPLLSIDRCHHRRLCNVWCEKCAEVEKKDEWKWNRDSCPVKLHLQGLHWPDSALRHRTVNANHQCKLGSSRKWRTAEGLWAGRHLLGTECSMTVENRLKVKPLWWWQ